MANYVVSFTETPPKRNDNVTWTTVQIMQAPHMAGPWTLIDTQAIAPDADPRNPDTREITTNLATAPEAYFTLTFADASGALSQPLMQIDNQLSEIRPTVEALAEFMPARTVGKGSGGGEIGMFTSDTRPTTIEAEATLDEAVTAVVMQTGADIPDRFIMQAKHAVLLYAAMLVELKFYRNEVNRDQSTFAQYQALFDSTITAFKMALADEDPASPAPAFWSVPMVNERQQHYQAIFNAMDPVTGIVDPSKLPVDEDFPMGPGGIPAGVLQSFPWVFGEGFPGVESDLGFLED